MSTQTETIRKALRRAANLPELNLSNYNDDDVASLNGSVIVLGVEAMDALAALSELEAQPSQTKDLEAFFERLRFDKTRHIGLGDIRLTIADQDELLSLTRSVAQPSAPTVDQIMEVVRKADKDWHDYYDDEEFWEDLRARLTKLLTNP